MAKTVTHKLIERHLVDGSMKTGEPLSIRVDQTLTQDATGTLVMLALEAMDLDRVKTDVSVQYVDHNLIQADYRNADDHLFLHSACRRFGIWYSRPGNGVSHPLHMQHFGKPGATLLGSDSHSCAAGALGMLAIGTGGLDVAMAMAGHPFRLMMPKVWGIRLDGKLPDWVSAKDVVLEMLRRHGVRGGVGWILEYFGPGLSELSAMDRHVIANMGAELGATTTVFPSDEATRRFLDSYRRGEDWESIVADEPADYDVVEEIDLSELVPLIAKPSSPGNVVPVREVEGQPIYQAYLGSSANPGFRDFAIAAGTLQGERIAPGVSFDVNPASRSILEDLIASGYLTDLLHAGARLHQAGCNGCIGMGQAPATGRNSLRTTPRNFPGRSGTKEDSVWLCGPETAVASALTGRITDPRDLAKAYPAVREPEHPVADRRQFEEPPAARSQTGKIELIKGPNVGTMPELEALPDAFEAPVLLVLGDDVSTDEILPAGTRVLPYRSNIEKIAEFSFEAVDETYVERARETEGPHAVVAGWNYGQGSSREHAALAPRTLGLRVVIARSFARIHRDNLINFGVLPLLSEEAADTFESGDVIELAGIHSLLEASGADEIELGASGKKTLSARSDLTEREREILKDGGLIRWSRGRRRNEAA